MAEFDYESLFCKVPPENTFHGDICPGPHAYFRGETYMPGANLHMGWQVITGPMPMEEPHFHHGVEEYLVFFGAQLPDVFSSWDAEIDAIQSPLAVFPILPRRWPITRKSGSISITR